MSDHTLDFVDDILPEEPNGELVHWMEPKPLSLGAVGITAATAGAFAIGVAATLGVLAVLHLLGPDREAADIPRRLKKLRKS
ncbi:hypothetical protein [Phenylobacterium deserti]|uniref:Uncharacterized protein n=1 Tax=Phenylobacterium deserti TaxID=1914756 RepID=A0A328ARK2_9CAUL|nr:hypothetical protein [Phenylobacterium deserti]RAK56935.1 hypothetical protein DJ018_02910 [Phenylobacterium deserti]